MRLALTALAVVLAGIFSAGVIGAQNTHSTYVDTTTNGTDTFSAVADWTAPTASAAVIGKAAGGDPGYIRANGSYYVYANVADNGNPAAGTASVNALVGNLTTSPTTAPATSGSYPIGGVTYNWRSAALTAKSTLAAGSASYSLTSTDLASPANSGTQVFTTTVDNTPPTGVSITSANVAGGTAGKPELGDTVTYTASEPLDPDSILAGWDGTTLNMGAAIYYDSSISQDVLDLGSLSATEATLGTISLGRSDYVSTSSIVYFGQSGTPSKMTRSGNSITVVLGTPSGATTTAAGSGTMHWNPNAGATDRAGNAMSTTVVNESANSNKDF